MRKTLAEIAKVVKGEVVGDKAIVITGLSGLEEAQEGDLTFVISSKYFSLAQKTKASAILAPRSLKIPGKSIIYTDNPSFAFGEVASMITDDETHRIKGIHSSALISKNVSLGKNVAIGPYVVIEEDTEIGDNTIICAGSFIGHHAKIGKDCFIFPQVMIRDGSMIGDRVMIHSGTVIGSDGFGFEQVKGVHKKIPQIGIVVIEDDVEIGSNVCIDRARFNKTVIGKGTKIDNLVQIGHNVVIGENCIIISQVGISGSTIIEKNCIFAGQVGVVGHIKVGEGTVVMSQSCLMKSTTPNSKVFGYPAKPHLQAKKINAHLQRLPIYVNKIQELEKKIEMLESKFKDRK